MVSRLLFAHRSLAVLSLLLCLLTSLVFLGEASAKNPYIIRDGHEGDPGDGVLSPVPEVDPAPTPKDNSVPVFTFTMILTGDNQLIPVFRVVGYFAAPWHSNPKTGPWIVQEGGYYDAP